jgi:hypothetical protein
MTSVARADATARGDVSTKIGTHVGGIIPGQWFAVALSLSALAVAMLLFRERLDIDLTFISSVMLLAGSTAAIGLRYRFRDAATRWQRATRDMAEYVGVFALISLLGAVASYPLAAASNGFVDPTLERIDQLFHFNWLGWYEFVAAHPSLQTLGSAAYLSIFVTPALLLGHFAQSGRHAEARQFLAAFWIAAVLTLMLFLFVPAEGPLAYLWHGGPIPYMPLSALYQSELIPALRTHAIGGIGLGDLQGLVCAPSFHTTSAVLYIATAWRIPVLRWPATALNIAMLAATPVEGTHYLTDMICGAMVALAALAAVSGLARRFPAETV